MNNQEIFVGLPVFQRNAEIKIQEIQKVHTATTVMLLKAASQLTSVHRSLEGNKGASDLTGPVNLLKDSLSLPGKVNQLIYRLRRHLIKPTLFSKYCKLADVTDESASQLFENKISDTGNISQRTSTALHMKR